MLWMLSALLLVLWLVGMVAAVGPWIHIVLALALFCVGMSLLHQDRFDTI